MSKWTNTMCMTVPFSGFGAAPLADRLGHRTQRANALIKGNVWPLSRLGRSTG